jgi:ligand-binding sensor domain-containing protein
MPISCLILVCSVGVLTAGMPSHGKSFRELFRLQPYVQMVSELYPLASDVIPTTIQGSLNAAAPARFWISNRGDRWALTDAAFELTSSLGYRRSYSRSSGMPYGPSTCIGSDPGNAVWICTDRGVVRFDLKASWPDRWRVLNSHRWLPDDRALNLAADGAGNVWVRTETGIAKIESQLMTPREKAAQFEEHVRQRHWRHGMVASSHL